jgi:hypothetical protein
MNKDNKSTELENTDKKLIISDVSKRLQKQNNLNGHRLQKQNNLNGHEMLVDVLKNQYVKNEIPRELTDKIRKEYVELLNNVKNVC